MKNSLIFKVNFRLSDFYLLFWNWKRGVMVLEFMVSIGFIVKCIGNVVLLICYYVNEGLIFFVCINGGNRVFFCLVICRVFFILIV